MPCLKPCRSPAARQKSGKRPGNDLAEARRKPGNGPAEARQGPDRSSTTPPSPIALVGFIFLATRVALVALIVTLLLSVLIALDALTTLTSSSSASAPSSATPCIIRNPPIVC